VRSSCNTASALRRNPRSAPAIRAGQAAQLRQHKTSYLVDHGFVRVTAHQFLPLLHQQQLQHLGLGRDVRGVSLRARRLLPLAPQVSQVGNAAPVEREAVTLRWITPSVSSLPM